MAGATVMTRLGTPDLVGEATDVVQARVVDQRVDLVDGRPWTRTTVRVVRRHKGRLKVGAKIEVEQPGGELGRLGMRVAGAARFSDAERVVLFLRAVGPRFVPVGMAQGKYQIYTDDHGRSRARRDLSGIAFAQLDTRGEVVINRDVRLLEGDPTLGALLEAVRRAVQQQSTGGAR